MEPETSVLMNNILTQSGYFTKKFYLNGGLEPSAFKKRIPEMEVVALGPFIQFAHSVNEQLKVESIAPTIAGVQKIIQGQ
jgi:di/tripeptidase